jgi:hypothetical protein
MGRVYTYTIPGIPAGQNDRLSRWERIENVKAFRGASEKNARSIFNVRQGRAIARARVTCTLIRTGTKPWDDGNAPGHLKPIVDGIVRSGLLKDDSRKYMDLTLPVPQERGPERSVRVQIEELET